MDPRINHEWTSYEVAQAKSIIAFLNNNNYYDEGDQNDAKHNNIIAQLHAWFPHKTMHQVKYFYIDLVAGMHLMLFQEESSSIGGSMHAPMNNKSGVPEEGVDDDVVTNNTFTMGGFVNDNFMMPQEMETSMGSNALVFGHPSNEMGIMEMEDNIEVNNPVVAPHASKFWTVEEHRSFLRGLDYYGRGKWKNISKYFVKTRTPVQVSSHAQKYFKRLKSKSSSGGQRYSINDVRLQDSDPSMMSRSNNPCASQSLAFAGSNYDSNFGWQYPMNSFVNTDNLPHFGANQHPPWSGQQMRIPTTTPMAEGTENFGYAGPQGSI